MSQDLVNWIFGGFGALISFVLNTIWNELKTLKDEDKSLAKAVSELQVLVAGNYVTRDELQSMVDALFKKLDKIDDKLDSKLDK
jgi:hypothetical protein